MSHAPPPSLGSRVSCQRAGSRFASSGPSARRGNGESLAVAQERDPPGERGAGGLTVAQRWANGGATVGKWWRSGGDPRAAATRKMRVVPVITPRRAGGG